MSKPSSSILLVIALLLVAPGNALSTGGEEIHSTTVRVASYNAWLLPIGSEDTDERRDQMGPAIDGLEPDIVCLQEVWTVEALEPVAESLEDRLPSVATGRGGLVILSRWPLRDAQFHPFPFETAASVSEWFARKGWLSAIVETPAGPLRVVNSHLAFDRSEGRPNHAVQLDMLVEALQGQSELPTILCADLNFRAFVAGAPTDDFEMLLDAGFEDAAGVTTDSGRAVRQGTRVGWPRAGRSARWDPDYVMFRQGDTGTLSVTAFRQALDDEATALSDHNLQLAEFVLTTR